VWDASPEGHRKIQPIPKVNGHVFSRPTQESHWPLHFFPTLAPALSPIVWAAIGSEPADGEGDRGLMYPCLSLSRMQKSDTLRPAPACVVRPPSQIARPFFAQDDCDDALVIGSDYVYVRVTLWADCNELLMTRTDSKRPDGPVLECWTG